jgi:hypothetical protein
MFPFVADWKSDSTNRAGGVENGFQEGGGGAVPNDVASGDLRTQKLD